MTSFNKDKLWIEAKQIFGQSNWVETAACYRELGGRNVFVYSVVDGVRRLIVDVLSENTVLLLLDDKLITDTYQNVIKSRKVFNYNEDIQVHSYILGETHYRIATEVHK